MNAIPLKPERKAQLEAYAQCYGQDPAVALDDVLAKHLEWEQEDYNTTVNAVQETYKRVKVGRTCPAAEFLEALRQKHGFPR